MVQEVEKYVHEKIRARFLILRDIIYIIMLSYISYIYIYVIWSYMYVIWRYCDELSCLPSSECLCRTATARITYVCAASTHSTLCSVIIGFVCWCTGHQSAVLSLLKISGHSWMPFRSLCQRKFISIWIILTIQSFLLVTVLLRSVIIISAINWYLQVCGILQRSVIYTYYCSISCICA